MRRIVLVALLLVACGAPPRTPSERCRRQAAASRIGRSMHPDPRLDEMENLRCQQLEIEERQNAREDQRSDAAQTAARDASNAELDGKLAQIRRAPQSPELGATSAEARVTCNRQRGSLLTQPAATLGGRDVLRCDVGGRAIFACVIDADRVVACDRYVEDGDLVATRERIETDLGPPERETVSDAGFRVFSWANGAVLLTMYEHGVRIRVARPSEK